MVLLICVLAEVEQFFHMFTGLLYFWFCNICLLKTSAALYTGKRFWQLSLYVCLFLILVASFI